MGYLLFVGILMLHSASAQLGRCDSRAVSIRPVTKPVVLGDGPHWDPQQKVLYFVDIVNQTLNRYDPVARLTTSAFIEGGAVSVIIPTRNDDDQFIITRGRDLVLISWDGFSPVKLLKVLATVDKDKPTNQFNDGKADASGRLWVGTMAPIKNANIEPNQGSFFSFSSTDNFLPKLQFSGVSISNGMGWNKNNTLMYYIDSPTRNISVFDFNLQRGLMSNRRTVFNFDDHDIPGIPDGMCLDENENLWIGVYNGSRIINVDPSNGNLIRTIRIPATLSTSCDFGGPELSTLYVTTGRLGLQAEEEPLAGSLFAVKGLGVSGQIKPNTAKLN